MPLIEHCICDAQIFRVVEAFNLPMRECVRCGVLHQSVDLSESELLKWYRQIYHKKVYTHSYEHDLTVGRSRVARYGKRLRSMVLDVGCGNGAFVDACRQAGIEAFGQDIAGDAADHRGSLDFVTWNYNVVTIHDVVEHVYDPVALLREAHRLVAPYGLLIIDFPDFFGINGEHHWKRIEHLWMFTERQLADMLNTAGFRVEEREEPVSGKFTLFARRI